MHGSMNIKSNLLVKRVFSLLNTEHIYINVLLTVHLDTINVLFANLMHNFFIKSIVFLYMFRALLRRVTISGTR